MAANSVTISMRLSARSSQRLGRLASRHGWTKSDASARLVEEGLRRAEFAFIDFRDSASGRQAYIQGSSLAVWEVAMVANDFDGDSVKTAKHLHWPESKVQAALNYRDAFPEEISEALAENEAMNFEALSRMLPQAKRFSAENNSTR